MNQSKANELYTRGNNAGLGYAPYTDTATDDTVAAAVEAAKADGWHVVHSAGNTSDVVVLSNEDGEFMGIGGDGSGNGAWAVMLDDTSAAAREIAQREAEQDAILDNYCAI
jgi:hypothetical protein